ncbi:MAG: hypothetical protein ACM3KM_03035 [Acidobacteriaceae bacterium]
MSNDEKTEDNRHPSVRQKEAKDQDHCVCCGAPRVKGGSANCWKCGAYIGFYQGEASAVSEILKDWTC